MNEKANTRQDERLGHPEDQACKSLGDLFSLAYGAQEQEPLLLQRTNGAITAFLGIKGYPDAEKREEAARKILEQIPRDIQKQAFLSDRLPSVLASFIDFQDFEIVEIDMSGLTSINIFKAALMTPELAGRVFSLTSAGRNALEEIDIQKRAGIISEKLYKIHAASLEARSAPRLDLGTIIDLAKEIESPDQRIAVFELLLSLGNDYEKRVSEETPIKKDGLKEFYDQALLFLGLHKINTSRPYDLPSILIYHYYQKAPKYIGLQRAGKAMREGMTASPVFKEAVLSKLSAGESSLRVSSDLSEALNGLMASGSYSYISQLALASICLGNRNPELKNEDLEQAVIRSAETGLFIARYYFNSVESSPLSRKELTNKIADILFRFMVEHYTLQQLDEVSDLNAIKEGYTYMAKGILDAGKRLLGDDFNWDEIDDWEQVKTRL